MGVRANLLYTKRSFALAHRVEHFSGSVNSRLTNSHTADHYARIEKWNGMEQNDDCGTVTDRVSTIDRDPALLPAFVPCRK